ncbi:cupin domain-containing protein [Dyadobacter sp. CY356]|uniref:cupin domain-containing protein n=1 Tax=Dyadobacter sp. CY356 TaxID=2906442 RepID=UPI001F43DE5D|nr:cupin domain-containing protein [Dyadobacter sp. CY356]MCF0056843.1 cupin domain-containing protein [Dyadobacter sp. CY356]
MKRGNFISALIIIFSVPSIAWANVKRVFSRSERGFKIPSGEGRIHGHIQLKGVNANMLDVKISGSDTNGDLAIFEQTSLSQGRGTPLHIHPLQDEIFYVMDGSYIFKVGEDKYDLKTGDSIFLPRKVPHAWTQVSEKGKMLVILQPAGKLENFFVTMAGLDHIPAQEEIIRIFNENEMQVVGPGLKVD